MKYTIYILIFIFTLFNGCAVLDLTPKSCSESETSMSNIQKFFNKRFNEKYFSKGDTLGAMAEIRGLEKDIYHNKEYGSYGIYYGRGVRKAQFYYNLMKKNYKYAKENNCNYSKFNEDPLYNIKSKLY